jgi:protein tyrosine phosphatase (PTP) superfamily phosphohydrolase (DUF442 family)
MIKSLRAGLCALGTTAALLAATSAPAQTLEAPNPVVITPQLTTSGQPTAAALGGLRAQGYEAVIYLAPPTVSDAVRDEALLVGRQGLVFVNVPIDFDRPTERDFEAFAGVLRGLAGRKVLVHCQVNLRASTLVFLYRTLVGKEDPRTAYDAVARVWSPQGPWKTLVQTLLRKHNVAFEPY